MNYAYLALLRLYPRRYRARFAAEMADVFAEARRDERRLGWLHYTWFLAQELNGLLQGALAAWMKAGSSHPHVARRFSLALSLLAGAVVTVAIHGSVYRGIHSSIPMSPHPIYSETDKFTALVLISLSCLLIAILLVALYYMTQRSIYARTRTARRHQNLHRYSRCAGRQLRSTPR